MGTTGVYSVDGGAVAVVESAASSLCGLGTSTVSAAVKWERLGVPGVKQSHSLSGAFWFFFFPLQVYYSKEVQKHEL